MEYKEALKNSQMISMSKDIYPWSHIVIDSVLIIYIINKIHYK